MNNIANDRVGPLPNPPHLGELIRESVDDVGWNVTEAVRRGRPSAKKRVSALRA